MQDKFTRCLGLVQQYNPLSIAPGALRKADNCLIRRKDIVESRRGYKNYSALANTLKQVMAYQNKVLVHYNDRIAYDNGSGTFTEYTGSYTEPTSSRIRFAEAFSNFYFTTSTGVRVFSNTTGAQARSAGAPRALDPSFVLSGAAGFLVNGNQCAYRTLIRRTDEQKNIIDGYPSQRMWVRNSAGAGRNVDITMFIPSDVIVGDIFQVYRTESSVSSGTDTAGDEMGLVYQIEITAAMITTGFITFTDSVTDSLRGATLYTSPSQEGIAQANERPPLCKSLCLYKNNFMLYANTSTKQRLFVTLVGAGSLTGKTITLSGTTYNFGASEIISGGGAPQVLVSTTGVAATDIDLTARSLVRVINRYTPNISINAYYLTGSNDLPGQIMLEEKVVGGTGFTLQASDAAIAGMYFPAPPVSPATNTKSTSSNQVQKNAIFFSKTQQGEAVPLLNYLLVGPSNREILRIVALRDSVIIIKEEGVYRLTGEAATSFTVTPVDLTLFCKAVESVAALDNAVYMLSNKGIVTISENGVEVKSWDIDPLIQPLLTNTNLNNITFGLGYESERSYYISTISDRSETVPNQTLIYNIFTETWVRHTYGFTSGLVEQKLDKLFLAFQGTTTLYQERKDFLDSDYADSEYPITLTALNGKIIDFTMSGIVPQYGWSINQGTTSISIKDLVITSGGYRATLTDAVPAVWILGAALIFPSVAMDLEWHSYFGGDPSMSKQGWQIAVLTDDTPGSNLATGFEASFKTNFDYGAEIVVCDTPQGGWGAAWGAAGWGGDGDSTGYPVWIPRNKQYFQRLTVGVKHKNARERMVIAGLGFSFRQVSEKLSRS